jgi:predicted alpha/beta hydrolase family esterase
VTINRRTFAALLTSGGVAALAAGCGAGGPSAAGAPSAVGAPSAGASAAAPVPAGPRNVVLVHGAYADGSCWADIIPRLQAAGVAVTAVQNPLTSLADDVAATRRALDAQDGPTVLVGHSYAGVVITQAGDHPLVRSLVYLSARAPDVNEDYPALAARFPASPASAGLVYREGFGGLTEQAFLADFANGVPVDRARVLYAVQGRVAQPLFATRTTVAAWRSKPTRYVITTDDRTTAPELQRFVAQRMGARTLEINSGHLSMITHPDTVAPFILDAVDGR